MTHDLSDDELYGDGNNWNKKQQYSGLGDYIKDQDEYPDEFAP